MITRSAAEYLRKERSNGNNTDNGVGDDTGRVSLIGMIDTNRCRKAFISIWNLSSVYILWIFIHYIATYVYVYYCTPVTVLGFLAAPFIIATPHCTGLRWCIARGAETISTMWVVLGTWLAAKLGGFT
jgi:hypothetical protein